MSELVRYSREGEGPPDALFTGAGGVAVPGWLPGREGRAPRRPAMYVLEAGVGNWYGVTRAAVDRWGRRYQGRPAPAAEFEAAWRGKPLPAWTEDSRTAWDAYRATMPGQGAKGRPKPGSGNRAKTPRQRVTAGAAAVGALIASYELKATVPAGARLAGAMDATGGRLIVTGTGAGRVAYAMDREDAAAASRVEPNLKFEPSRRS